MPAAYIMRKDSAIREEVKAGATVYRCKEHDYGCANDDFRATGKEHIAVTLKADGGYPFFTVPVEDLDNI